MSRSSLADAFEHHAWATVRLIDTCLELIPAQLETAVPGTYGSILDTMRHLVGADCSYLSTVTGGLVARIDEGSPDGMAIDDEGCLWVAVWGGKRVDRIDPRSGERIATVSVPASHVSSVAFGGAGLDELYITTARDGLDAHELQAEPHAGDLFVVRPGVTGPAPYRFAGVAV